MHALPPRACAFLAVLLLAGCVQQGPAPRPDAGPSAAGALSIPWELVDCAFVAFSVAVDPERLAPYLPEGFEVATGSRVLLPVDAGPQAAFLGLEAFECASGLGLDGGIEALDYGSFFTFATPPEALRNATIEEYYVKWDALVPDGPRREALAARGLPARAGEATVGLQEAAEGVRLDAALRLEGVGGFTLTGAGTRGAGAAGFEFIEYTPAEGGSLAAWHGFTQDRDSVARGRGVVEIEPGTWIAEVVGGTRAAVAWSAGEWTFLDGAVTHPVRTLADVR